MHKYLFSSKFVIQKKSRIYHGCSLVNDGIELALFDVSMFLADVSDGCTFGIVGAIDSKFEESRFYRNSVISHIKKWSR